MSITRLKPPTRHADRHLLSVLAAWNLHRANARAIWAKQDAETNFLTENAETKHAREAHASLEAVSNCEFHLQTFKPYTTLGASQLLFACVDILQTAQRDPDSEFADGPVLSMLINAAHQLARSDIALETTNEAQSSPPAPECVA